MSEAFSLRQLRGAPVTATPLQDAVLILIDCQNTYTGGLLKLDGVDAAMENASVLLQRARAVSAPIIHIAHDAGPGSPFDVRAESGAIAAPVAPSGNEPILIKTHPNSFWKTDLESRLETIGKKSLILVGFMTHMCVNSTARAAYNRGFQITVPADATATRALPDPRGGELPASTVQAVSLAAMADVFATVVPGVADVPDR
ncbi:MAG: cysteine hydrolase [Rhodobiaceae bacterium]|nr:cysteine hydrolase [Rhodobiaceae bacterium]MCC0012076.1 cysteine hydrolase [Rhodobiaceae bacterium]MCC0061008.1 cysteine hydrolase [Rhodobiaceae bacterium]